MVVGVKSKLQYLHGKKISKTRSCNKVRRKPCCNFYHYYQYHGFQLKTYQYNVFDVTLCVYPHRAGWKVSLKLAEKLSQRSWVRFPPWSGCPVWIYTQSNIKNIIFTWVHNTKTHTKISYQYNSESLLVSLLLYLVLASTWLQHNWINNIKRTDWNYYWKY
jgi:hypothetical protein